MATSVGGVLTGRGGDLIIIDDALKPDEALSETRRKAVNDWYDNTLFSRLNDKANGCIMIIMQRLHQEDLVGHVLEQEPWEVLSFPAIAEQDESFVIESPIGRRWFQRKVGEALHPQRETLRRWRLSANAWATTTFPANTSRTRFLWAAPWSRPSGCGITST